MGYGIQFILEVGKRGDISFSKPLLILFYFYILFDIDNTSKRDGCSLSRQTGNMGHMGQYSKYVSLQAFLYRSHYKETRLLY